MIWAWLELGLKPTEARVSGGFLQAETKSLKLVQYEKQRKKEDEDEEAEAERL